MDINKLVEVLRATLVPDQREQAEQQLNEVSQSCQNFQDGCRNFDKIKQDCFIVLFNPCR